MLDFDLELKHLIRKLKSEQDLDHFVWKKTGDCDCPSLSCSTALTQHIRQHTLQQQKQKSNKRRAARGDILIISFWSCLF